MSGSVVFLGLALLVLLAGLLARRRVNRARDDRRLSNEMIRRIERVGRIEFEADEPLDLDEIRREEDEFWSRTWDEPEEL